MVGAGRRRFWRDDEAMPGALLKPDLKSPPGKCVSGSRDASFVVFYGSLRARNRAAASEPPPGLERLALLAARPGYALRSPRM